MRFSAAVVWGGVTLLVGACSGGAIGPGGYDGDAGVDAAGAGGWGGAGGSAAGMAGAAGEDAAADASSDAVGVEAGTECFVDTVGVFGECLPTSDCDALGAPGDYVSTPGYCPGPADVECCTLAPNVADNPPVPAGWQLMQESQVTPEMTNWAVSILYDPVTYPMFSTTTQTFGTLDVLARVEWHPPDFQNSSVHRGVTLYVPA